MKADFAPLYTNYGLALIALNRFDEAFAVYDKGVSLDPRNADLFNNYGNALRALNRRDEALARYDKAVSLRPDFPDALNNRGVVLQELGRIDDALASFDLAISARPDFGGAYFNRGNVLQDFGRFDEALESYDKAISLIPQFADAFNNRGNTLKQLKRHQEALESFDRAIALNPRSADAYSNRGIALYELNRLDDALESYAKATALAPDFADAFSNLGNALRESKRFEEALASYDRAVAINPQLAQAHGDRGLLLLLMGRFAEGWRSYEWRKKKKERLGARSFDRPLWLGEEDISGKTILVHWEQGLGDTLQFCRYVPILSQMGAKVLFAPHKPLRRLISTLSGAFQMADVDDGALAFDFHCPLLSLPLALRTQLETIPHHVPYLQAEPDLVSAWKARIGGHGFKIGICWQGSTGKVDAGRSFALKQFEALSQMPDVRLISLHKGEGEAQLQGLPEGMSVETLGSEFDAGGDAFVDTAAAMACCDLIISSDTAVAHLAGALGLKVWVALKCVPDWRWMMDRNDSPWYPTMRLFRQQSHGDWDGVFAQMKDALLKEHPRQ